MGRYEIDGISEDGQLLSQRELGALVRDVEDGVFDSTPQGERYYRRATILLLATIAAHLTDLSGTKTLADLQREGRCRG